LEDKGAGTENRSWARRHALNAFRQDEIWRTDMKNKIVRLTRMWPVVVVATGAVLTVVWAGALIWVLATFLVGVSGI